MPIQVHARKALPVLLAVSLTGAAPQVRQARVGEWQTFGNDAGAQRFSTLRQITSQNVGALQQAWAFDTGSRDLQVTPLVINGLMYLTGGSAVHALEPETGKPVWRYDAGSAVSKRGVAYWPGDQPCTVCA